MTKGECDIKLLPSRQSLSTSLKDGGTKGWKRASQIRLLLGGSCSVGTEGECEIKLLPSRQSLSTSLKDGGTKGWKRASQIRLLLGGSCSVGTEGERENKKNFLKASVHN